MDHQKQLFTRALGLEPPWEVSEIRFSLEASRLDLTLTFPKGSHFRCPECGAEGAVVHDTREHTWRHLNFFQHKCYLRANVPRVKCPQGCGVKQVEVPWARPRSGFTLLFEAWVLMLAKEMPIQKLAEWLGEHDTRLWRVLHHYVEMARQKEDFSEVRRIGVDETAARRGHDYVTFFMDLDARRLLFGTPGKDKDTLERFVADLQAHKGDSQAIERVCSDLSPAFIAGVQKHLPQAAITFDRFHVTQLMNKAVDEVRRQEVRENRVLKRTRYLWLKNPDKLSVQQTEQMKGLAKENLKTGRAYAIRLALQDFFEQENRDSGEAHLKRWYFWATHSRLEPVIKAAKTIKSHWEGIVSWFDSHITNGILEGTNSLIQAAKAKARGYRSHRNLITMAYLIAGDLKYDLPT